MFLERTLEWSPDARAARTRLGFRRVQGEWTRRPEEAGRVAAWLDTDYGKGTVLRRDAQAVEVWRAGEILKECRRDGEISPEDRQRLDAVLARAPGADDVHKALGHRWTGRAWIRPALEETARRHRALEERLRGLRVEAVALRPLGVKTLPGTTHTMYVYEADGQLVGVDKDHYRAAEPLRRGAVAQIVRARRCIHIFFPGLDPLWRPERVFLLPGGPYHEAIDAAVRGAEARRRAHLTSTFEIEAFAAYQGNDLRRSLDMTVHAMGYRTGWNAARVAAAAEGSNSEWFAEALGFLLTLEVLGTADTWFYSLTESSPKATAQREPPRPRTRADCARYLRESLMEGSAYPLVEIVGRPLNGLDLLSALEAWSFVRFLAAHRPEGLRALPGVLRGTQGGSGRDRAARAVRKAVGASLEELAPLWRAFVLEVL